MFVKRALFTWRNWKLMLLQISVILVFTTYLLRTIYSQHDLPMREMDLSQYGRTIVPYSISGNSDLALNFINNLKIFLKRKNQELREVQGKTHREKKRLPLYEDPFVLLTKKGVNYAIYLPISFFSY